MFGFGFVLVGFGSVLVQFRFGFGSVSIRFRFSFGVRFWFGSSYNMVRPNHRTSSNLEVRPNRSGSVGHYCSKRERCSVLVRFWFGFGSVLV